MKTRKQVKMITLYAVLAALALLLIIIKRESFSSFIGEISHILRPVIIGAVIAYLCNPIFRIFEKRVFSSIRSFTARRVFALIGTYIVLAIIFVVLLMLIIPQLLTSVLDFLENYETLMDTALENINGLIAQINQSLHTEIPSVKPETLKAGFDWIVENVSGYLIESFCSIPYLLVSSTIPNALPNTAILLIGTVFDRFDSSGPGGI